MSKLTYRGSEYTKFKSVRLHKDDEVVVIAGKEKGKKGKILVIDKKRDRVVVEGLNKRKRFLRPTQENPQGGIVEVEAPMHISNVMFYDSKKKKGVRLGYQENKGKKVRVSKPEGKEI
ncbi:MULTISPECIES: 50S ribosomal protein L24 [Leptospira]|uniref:Large ribosomal subunit protein uL24 n=2 Tax=Leptospira TaxID=171 RepID=A0ABX4PM05_9LEPT|nr:MULTISPECIES: 50S ribosomal protein L24 [Leptospira]EIE03286.1 ribosomal protein L24 [Leptospira licerasiae serovar Varillal str. VAR 010]EJZ41431.1 ribosomal protein L24 [Leptospira licerasiae str. MMD4847]PKA16073.1 50S ribosomal protein L24 [Leptospira haakeii]PKA19140.1 50S ribosomal protein L24 [Leptospira haakeii]TGM89954.1 50S ribosomal protein L24 [Leptospira licerasiae]